jgi:hypothetical protein
MVTEKEKRLLRIGVLGCGPIAQIAHLDACRKARNAELDLPWYHKAAEVECFSIKDDLYHRPLGQDA